MQTNKEPEIGEVMRAHDNRLIVEDPPHQETSKGGIIIVGGERLDVVASTVRAVGPNVKDKEIKVGDRVLHVRVAGVKYEGPIWGARRSNYKIIMEKELLGVLMPGAVFEGGRGSYDHEGNHDLSKD